MTRYLFIDNFRGFTNTYIPLLDVNFFVGENSSGKTSVLSLLKLISTNEFTWGQKFNSQDVNFGHFRDMVSAHSADRSYFSIGVIDEHGQKKSAGKAITSASMYTFREHDGLARLSQFNSLVGNRQILLRFDGKKVSFKSGGLPKDLTVDGIRNITMQEWVEERASNGSDYRPVADSPGYPRTDEYPLYIPLMRAIEQSVKKGEGEHAGPLFYGRPEIVWIAPIRTQPERTYDDISQSDFSAEGAHTPYLIRKVLESSDGEPEKFKAFIAQAGKNSGLFESIKINRHGTAITAPFEVDAVVDGLALNLINGGYGVSQSLPVFVEIFTRPTGSWFAIQQPEVHLHPRAQAALGDAFFLMATADDKRFLIETHSDFTIDRFRMNYRRKRTKRTTLPQSQILFFERHNKRNTVTPLPIGRHGELPSD